MPDNGLGDERWAGLVYSDPVRGAGWNDFGSGITFDAVLCEIDTFRSGHSDQLAYYLDPDVAWASEGPRTLKPAITVSLPTATSTIVYGATLMTAMAYCAPSDSWWLAATHDQVIFLNSAAPDNNCRMFLAGTQTVLTYNVLVQNAWWHTDHTERPALRHAYVYWRKAAMRYAVINVADAKVFTIVPGFTVANPPSSYLLRSAVTACSTTDSGMFLAEPDSAHSSLELRETIRKSWVRWNSKTDAKWLLGFSWSSNAYRKNKPTPSAMTYYDWTCAVPSGTQKCTVMNQYGRWDDNDCDTKTNGQGIGVVCQSDNYPFSNVMDNYGRFPSVDLPQTKRREVVSDTVITAADLRLFPDRVQTYGIALQLSVMQCRTGDSFTLSTTGYGPSVASTKSVADVCAYNLIFVAGGAAASVAKVLLSRARISFSDQTRIQFHVGWYIMTDARVAIESDAVLMDVEQMLVYIWLPYQNTAWSWEEGCRACVSKLHAPFELVSVMSPVVERLMQRSRAFLESPLRARRGAVNSEFSWLVTGTSTLQATDKPLFTGRLPQNGPDSQIDLCLAQRLGGYDSATGVETNPIWNSVNCDPGSGNPPNFRVAMCRGVERLYWSGTVVLNGRTSTFDRPFAGKPFPLVGALPDSLSTENIFGATITVSKSASKDTSPCLSTSTWYFPTTSHDNIGVLRYEPCALFLSGLATMSEYGTLLRGLEYRVTRPLPMAAWFGAVYWTVRHLRDMIVAPQTKRVYALVPANTWWQPPTAYTYWSAKDYCNFFGFDVFEAQSAAENDDVLALRASTLDRGDIYIGATAVSGVYRWWSTNSITYHNFLNRVAPTAVVTGKECTVMTAWGAWKTVPCTDWVRGGVLCRYPTQAYLVSVSTQVTFLAGAAAATYPVLESTRLLQYSGSYVVGIFAAADVSWLPTTQQLFGATLQLSTRQCTATDSFAFDNPTTAARYVRTLIADSCALMLRDSASAPAGFALSYLTADLGTIRLAVTDTTRRQLTFALMLWIDPSVRYMLTDVDTQHAYVRLSTAFTDTWQKAADRCGSALGSQWYLITPNSEPERMLLSSSMPTPIQLLRNASGAFVWGTDLPFLYSALTSLNTYSKECAIATDQTTWTECDCNTVSAPTSTVVCEAASWNATAFVWLSSAENAESSKYRQLIPLSFDSTNTTVIYGATVQVARRECYTNDRYVFGYGFNILQLQYADACTLMLSGTATVAQYNYALKGVYHRSSEFRAYIAFRSIYWYTVGLDQMLYSWAALADRTFAVVKAQTTFTPSGTYPFYGANYMCSTFSGRLAEITSAAYNSDVQAVAKPTTNYLGAQRTSSTASFWWLTNTTQFSYAPYVYGTIGGEPVAGNLCLSITPSGLWRSTPCTTPMLDGAVCEFVTWPGILKANVTFMPGNSAPPTANRTRERILTFNTAGEATIFDSADVATFNDGTSAYGATVQLNVKQVLAGDDFTYTPSSSLMYISSFSVTKAGQCVLALYATLSDRLTDHFKGELVRVKFAPVQRSRTQLQFSYIVWLTAKSFSSTVYPSMMFDAETRHAYSYFSFTGTTMTWAETLSTCRNLGPMWDLPTVNSASENSILRTYQRSGAVPDFPLRATRSGTGQMLWDNGERITFADWNVASAPMQDKAYACLAMAGNSQPAAARGHMWEAVDCTASLFQTVVCETEEWTAYGVVSYLGAKNFNPSGIVLRNLVPAANLASSGLTRQVYGMTVQTVRDDCRSTDSYLSTTNDAYIFVAYSDPCSIMFAGTGTVADYIRFADGTVWTTIYSNRTKIGFGAVLWSTPYVGNLVLDFSRSVAYFLLVAETQYSPAQAFMPTSSQLCSWNNMYLAQTSTLKSAEAFEALERVKDAYLGLTNTFYNGQFQFISVPNSSTLDFSSRWLRDEPVLGNDCVMLTTWNVWISVPCTEPIPSVGCEIASSSSTQLIFRNMTLPADSVARRRDLFRAFRYAAEGTAALTLSPFVNVSQSDLQWLNSTAVLYGVTVQLAMEQCVSGDAFSIDTVALPDASFVLTAFPSSCAARLVKSPGAWPASIFYPALDAIRFAPAKMARIRRQLAFGYVLWTNELVPNMVLDFVSGSVLTTSQSKPTTSPLLRNWDEAWGYCRRLGPTWTLPLPSSLPSARLLHAAATSATASLALAMRRTPANQFVWTDMRPQNFVPWDAGSPGLAAAGNCTLSAPSTLSDVSSFASQICTLPTFGEVMCEAPQWQGSGIITYSIEPMSNASVKFYPVIQATQLPSASMSAIVFGATLQVRRADCRATDQFYATSSYDGLLVVFSSPCTVMLAGRGTLAEYAPVVGGFGIASFPTSRASIAAAVVMWPSASLQYALMDADLVAGARSVFAPVLGRFGGAASALRRDYPSACTEAGGLTPAEPTTAGRQRAVRDSAVIAWQQTTPGVGLVGLTRLSPAPNPTFVGWNSGTTPATGSIVWAPTEPAATPAGLDCITMLASGMYTAAACSGATLDAAFGVCGWSSSTYTDAKFLGAYTTVMPIAVNASSLVGTVAHRLNVEPPTSPPSSRAVMIGQRQSTLLAVKPFADDPALAVGGPLGSARSVTHGATVQLPPQLCDSLPFNRTDAPNFVSWWAPSSASGISGYASVFQQATPCRLVMQGTGEVASYAAVLRQVELRLDFASHPLDQWMDGSLPSAITASYALWPPLVGVGYAFNAESGNAYAWYTGRVWPMLTPFRPRPTREGAFGVCTSLTGGAGLSSLPVVLSLADDRALRRSAPTTTLRVPLGLHRAAASGPYKWLSGAAMSFEAWLSASEPTTTGAMAYLDPSLTPYVLNTTNAVPGADLSWATLDHTAQFDSGTPLACEIDGDALQDSFGVITLRVVLTETLPNTTSLGGDASVASFTFSVHTGAAVTANTITNSSSSWPSTTDGMHVVRGAIIAAVLPGNSASVVYGATLYQRRLDSKAGDAWLVPAHSYPIATVSAPMSSTGQSPVVLLRGRTSVTAYNAVISKVALAVPAYDIARSAALGTLTASFAYWPQPWMSEVYLHVTSGTPTVYVAVVPIRVHGASDTAALSRGATSYAAACADLGGGDAEPASLDESGTLAAAMRVDLTRYSTCLTRPTIGVRVGAGEDSYYSNSGLAVTQPFADPFWLAQEPRYTLVTLATSGRWRAEAMSTTRRGVMCTVPTAPMLKGTVTITAFQPPPGNSAATPAELRDDVDSSARRRLTFTHPTWGTLSMYPFVNSSDPSIDASDQLDVLSQVRASTLLVYGLSVQLVGDCRPSAFDTISVAVPASLTTTTIPSRDGSGSLVNVTIPDPIIARGAAAGKYFATACIFMVDFAAPIPARDTAPLFNQILFTTKSPSRTALQFAFVLWPSPRTRDMFVDSRNGVAVARVALPTAFAGQRSMAESLCAQFGPRWSLLKAPSRTLQWASLFATLKPSTATTSPLLFLDASETPITKHHAYDDGTDVVEAPWAAGHPKANVPCVALAPNGTTAANWQSVLCTTPLPIVRCQVPLQHLVLHGFVRWTLTPHTSDDNENATTAPALIGGSTFAGVAMPENVTSVAADPTRSIYGLRAMVSYATCRDADRWEWDGADARLILAESRPCTVEVVGRAQASLYITALAGLRHVTGVTPLPTPDLPTRSEVALNAIFYLVPHLVRVALDAESLAASRLLRYSGVGIGTSLTFCSVLRRAGSTSPQWEGASLDSYDKALTLVAMNLMDDHFVTLGAGYNSTGWRWANDKNQFTTPTFLLSYMRWMNGEKYLALGSTKYNLAATSFGQWRRAATTLVTDAVACGTAGNASNGEVTGTVRVPVSPTTTATPASTTSTRRLTVPLTSFNPIRPSDLPPIDDTTIIYAAVVHVPIQQCVAGVDGLSVPSDCPLRMANLGINARPYAGDCSLSFSGPQPAFIYKQLLCNCTRYDSVASFKVQIAFSWALSVVPKLWHRLSYDVVGSKLYASIPFADAATWDGAAAECQSLGPGWRLPTIANDAENRIVQGVAQAAAIDANIVASIPLSSFTAVPLGMAKNSESATVWAFSGMSVAYQNFDAGTTPTTGWDCFMMLRTTGTWVDTHCRTRPFPIVVCETTGYGLVGLLTYATAPTDLTPAQSLPVFQTGDLNEDPLVENNQIYGAVVQISAQDSRPSDRMLASTASDNTLLVRVGAYVLQLVGKTSIKEYNRVLKGVQLLTYNTERQHIRAAYLYYTSPAITNAFIDLSRFSVASPVIWVPFFLPLTDVANPFTQMKASDFCVGLGLSMNVTTTAEQAAEQIVATVYPLTMLGKRPTANGSFYDYDNTFVRRFGPTCATCDACVALTVYGKWRPVPCTAPQSGIICSGYAATGTFGFVRFQTAVISPPNVHADRSNALPASFASQGVHFPWKGIDPWPNIPAGSQVFGLTAQVPPAMCVDTNASVPFDSSTLDAMAAASLQSAAGLASYFALATTAPIGALASQVVHRRVLGGCVSFFAASSTAGVYRDLARNLAWATNDPSLWRVISYALSLWTDPRLTDVTYQWSDASIVAALQTPSPKTWYESYGECALLGPSWQLPSVTSPDQQRLLAALSPNLTLAIGALRITGSPFVWTDGELLAYQAWASTFPVLATTECAVANATSSGDRGRFPMLDEKLAARGDNPLGGTGEDSIERPVKMEQCTLQQKPAKPCVRCAVEFTKVIAASFVASVLNALGK
jgi:hypothetical protein